MKIFISADLEGITNVTHRDETDIDKVEYVSAREQMTAEVAAACNGAFAAGATEIWVRDAHDSARNLIPNKLPLGIHLIRGWSPDPLMMMENLDESFQAALFIGYHSRAGSNTSPLAHTMTGSYVRVTLNGCDTSEFRLNTYSAALFKVPVVFVSGDKGLCIEASELNSNIETLAVKEGIGNATINIHPELAIEKIQEGVTRALKGDLSGCLVSLPEYFKLDVQFKDQTRARKYSFYPAAKLKDPTTVSFEHKDYFEVLRFLLFAS